MMSRRIALSVRRRSFRSHFGYGQIENNSVIVLIVVLLLQASARTESYVCPHVKAKKVSSLSKLIIPTIVTFHQQQNHQNRFSNALQFQSCSHTSSKQQTSVVVASVVTRNESDFTQTINPALFIQGGADTILTEPIISHQSPGAASVPNSRLFRKVSATTDEVPHDQIVKIRNEAVSTFQFTTPEKNSIPPTSEVASRKSIETKKSVTFRTMIASALQRDRNKSIFIASVAGLAGFADVLYSLRYGCYVNMMTGTTIHAIRNFLLGQYMNGAFFISILLAYMTGNLLSVNPPQIPSTLLQRKKLTTERIETPKAVVPRCIQIIPSILVLFTLADIICYNPANARWGAVALSMAYGLINSISIEVTGGSILYALTGHYSKFIKAFADVMAMSSKYFKVKSQRREGHISVTEVIDEKKFVDTLYLISYHSRIVVGFSLGVIAGLRLLACMPTLVAAAAGVVALGEEVTTASVATAAVCSSTSSPFWSHAPINTMIGVMYGTVLYWYGKHEPNNNKTTK